MMDYERINQDKNLFALPFLPLVTVYDDNLFVRNDYDVLSLGQRNYLIRFFAQLGFKQKSGRLLQCQDINLHFPRPNSNLAISSYTSDYLSQDGENYYCVTPTMMAEALFHLSLTGQGLALEDSLKQLINKCPFNIEWLRDISYRSEIEAVTKGTFAMLSDYQANIIKEKFKMKKAL